MVEVMVGVKSCVRALFPLLELAEEANPHRANHIYLPHRVRSSGSDKMKETGSLLGDGHAIQTIDSIDWAEVAKPIQIYGWGMDRISSSIIYA